MALDIDSALFGLASGAGGAVFQTLVGAVRARWGRKVQLEDRAHTDHRADGADRRAADVARADRLRTAAVEFLTACIVYEQWQRAFRVSSSAFAHAIQIPQEAHRLPKLEADADAAGEKAAAAAHNLTRTVEILCFTGDKKIEGLAVAHYNAVVEAARADRTAQEGAGNASRDTRSLLGGAVRDCIALLEGHANSGG